MRYLALLVAVVLLPATALAQFGMLGMNQGGAMSASSMRQNFDGYADMLGMDDDQREAGLALVDAYMQEGLDLMESFQARMEVMQGGMRDDPMAAMEAMRTKMPDMIEELMTQATAIEDGMLADIQVLLSEEQTPMWARVERRHRRLTSMAGQIGMTHGEAADLIAIVEKIAPDEAPLADDLLLAYELDVDRALTARNEMIKTEMRRIFEESMSFMMPGGAKSDKESPFVMMRKAGLKIRDVNRRYARQFAAALPEDMRGEFDDQFKLASFPEIYSRTSLSRRITAAEGLSDLTDEQKSRLDAIGAKYTRELKPLNEAYAHALSAYDDDLDNANPMASAMMFMGGPEELNEVKDAKKAFEEETNRQLEDVLVGEQLARLPEFSTLGYYEEIVQQAQEAALGAAEVDTGDP